MGLLCLLTGRLLAITPGVHAQMPDPPGQVTIGEQAAHDAYLFAHMTHADYGRLYYSVSTDGLHWRSLNQGRRVFDDYKGHADICRGHDGRYYLVGNRHDGSPDVNFWASDDLIDWQKHGSFAPDLKNVPDYASAIPAIGAPKVFFDDESKQYVVTWHTPHRMTRDDLPEPYWASQRTLYVASPDLKTFSNPRKLFAWDMATIDVILRREGDQYFAIVKDERYPTLDWPTGKMIRVCTSSSLLGPYSEPGPPVSPGFREAPTLVRSPNGQAWYLYYEQYPGVSYGLSVSKTLAGPWFQASGATYHRDWDKYELPRQSRHGSMLPITCEEYDALVAAFGLDNAESGTTSGAE
ncbi:MAG: glycoside hydrolase family 43 protein [Pirellulales bacterium]|nr:glycoside hydrolase family 43 protein [Pirellulales bacterium]